MANSLVKRVNTVKDFLDYLTTKGFHFGEEAIGFIEFGQHYTSASDELVNVAIEITLKAQKEFDGSFFISLLERCKEHHVINRREALSLARQIHII